MFGDGLADRGSGVDVGNNFVALGFGEAFPVPPGRVHATLTLAVSRQARQGGCWRVDDRHRDEAAPTVRGGARVTGLLFRAGHAFECRSAGLGIREASGHAVERGGILRRGQGRGGALLLFGGKRRLQVFETTCRVDASRTPPGNRSIVEFVVVDDRLPGRRRLLVRRCRFRQTARLQQCRDARLGRRELGGRRPPESLLRLGPALRLGRLTAGVDPQTLPLVPRLSAKLPIAPGEPLRLGVVFRRPGELTVIALRPRQGQCGLRRLRARPCTPRSRSGNCHTGGTNTASSSRPAAARHPSANTRFPTGIWRSSVGLSSGAPSS